MDNAVDALHLAFVSLILVIALSVAIYMITLARQTSEIVFVTMDDTAYLSYKRIEKNNNGITSQNRIVGFETIIPTLFKYSMERYAIVFLDASEAGWYDEDLGIIHRTKPLIMYEEDTNIDNWKDGSTFLLYSIIDNQIDKAVYTKENVLNNDTISGNGLLGSYSVRNI